MERKKKFRTQGGYRERKLEVHCKLSKPPEGGLGWGWEGP